MISMMIIILEFKKNEKKRKKNKALKINLIYNIYMRSQTYIKYN